MHTCDRCRGEFSVYAEPGKCPLCNEWVTLECAGCAHSAAAFRFISAGDKCPKCGRDVKVPGRHKTSPLLWIGLGAIVVAFILLIYIFATRKVESRALPDLPTRAIETPS